MYSYEYTRPEIQRETEREGVRERGRTATKTKAGHKSEQQSFGPQSKILTFSYDGRTQLDSTRRDATPCLQKVLGQTAVSICSCSCSHSSWLTATMACSWVRCLSVLVGRRLRCRRRLAASCVESILNFRTWPGTTAVRATPLGQDLSAMRNLFLFFKCSKPRLKLGLGTGPWQRQTADGQRQTKQTTDGSCKQSELTAWQALSHEKWKMKNEWW